MSIPEDFSVAQRQMLLELACAPPGRWLPCRGHVATVRSLQRRGLVETNGREVRLAHNSWRAETRGMTARNGGAPV